MDDGGEVDIEFGYGVGDGVATPREQRGGGNDGRDAYKEQDGGGDGAVTTLLKSTTTAQRNIDIARMTQNHSLVPSDNRSSEIIETIEDDVDAKPPPVSLVSGLLYEDNTSRGIEGITVHLVNVDVEENRRKSVATDHFGAYSFTGVRPGTYVIRIADMVSSASSSWSTSSRSGSASSVSGSTNASVKKNMSTQRIISVGNGEWYLGLNFGRHRLKEDVYSLLFFAEDCDKIKATIAYVFVFVVYCTQIFLLMILINDIQYYSLGRWYWTFPLPRIPVPVPVSRFLICLVAAVFQRDILALARLLFSGYGGLFPHRTTVHNADKFLFVTACTSRFVIKAIGLLVSLIIVIYNDNVFDLTSNFLTLALVINLHNILFRMLLVSPFTRGVLGIWKGKAQMTKDHEYLTIGGRVMVMRRLEYIFILSAMPGLWGWTWFLEPLNQKVVISNDTSLSVLDGEVELPSVEELRALRDEIESTNVGISTVLADHETVVQMLQQKATESNNRARLLQEEIDTVRLSKVKEVVALHSASQKALEQADAVSLKEAESLRKTIETTTQDLEGVRAEHARQVKALRDEASSKVSKTVDENERLLKEKVREVAAEKDRELKAARAAGAEALRKKEAIWKGDSVGLRNEIVVAKKKIQSVQKASDAKTKEEVKVLQNAVKDATGRLEKIRNEDAIEVKRLREKASTDLIAVQARHELELKTLKKEIAVSGQNSLLLQDEATLAEFEEMLKFICPTLLANNTQGNTNIMRACLDFVPHNELHPFAPVVSPTMAIFRGNMFQGLMYGVLMITIPALQKVPHIQILSRKIFVFISLSRPALGKQLGVILSRSRSWFKGRPTTNTRSAPHLRGAPPRTR